MNAHQFRQFVQYMRQLLIDKHRSDYRMGQALNTIRDDRLWETWPRDDRPAPGYESFAEYCDRECGYSVSSASAKIINYVKLRAIGLPEDSDTFSRCLRLGWSKLSEVLRAVVDEPGLVAWLNDVEGRNLTVMGLRARIAEARANLPSRSTEEEAEEAPSLLPRGPGRRAGPAVEPPARPTRPTTRGYVGYEVRFESQAALDAFTRSVDMIRRRYGDVGMGRAIEMMSVQYLATAPRLSQGGAPLEVENLLRTIESAYGIKLQVVAAAKGRKKQSKSLKAMRGDSAR
jgi:hypothetical protein